jgi:hypothetical protein
MAAKLKNRLMYKMSPSEVHSQRYQWESMQNAKDSIVGSPKSIVELEIISKKNSLEFLHYGKKTKKPQENSELGL